MNGYYKQVIEELTRHHWKKVKGGKGSHEKWEKGGKRVIVPFNLTSRFTANAVMRAAGIDRHF